MLETYTTKKGNYELVDWQDVKEDMQYPKSDNNKGYIFGLYHLDDNLEVVDVNWYKTEKERDTAIDKAYYGGIK